MIRSRASEESEGEAAPLSSVFWDFRRRIFLMKRSCRRYREHHLQIKKWSRILRRRPKGSFCSIDSESHRVTSSHDGVF